MPFGRAKILTEMVIHDFQLSKLVAKLLHLLVGETCHGRTVAEVQRHSSKQSCRDTKFSGPGQTGDCPTQMLNLVVEEHRLHSDRYSAVHERFKRDNWGCRHHEGS